MSAESQVRTQVSCDECGHVRFDGEWTQEAAHAHAGARECPICGSTRATINMAAMTATARMNASYKAEVHEAGHESRRASIAQKQAGGTFARGDGRGHVERGMIISKRPPRFKWHRVVDEVTGRVEKNLLERHDDETGKPTGDTWDFTDPSVEPPDWFRHDPRPT